MTRRLICALAVFGLLGARSARGDDGELQALIDKGIKALGGAASLGKLRAATWKGKGKVQFQGNDIDFTGEWAVDMPGKMRTKIDLDINGVNVTIVRVLSGDKGWVKQGDNEAAEMRDDELAREKAQAATLWVLTLVPLKARGVTLKPAGESKVDGQPAIGMTVAVPGGRTVKLFLDKEKGLPVKIEARVKDLRTGNEIDQEILYSDYKEVNGIKRAMKTTVRRDGKIVMEVTASDYKPVEKLDAGLFEKP
jgi:hypothetical protein